MWRSRNKHNARIDNITFTYITKHNTMITLNYNFVVSHTTMGSSRLLYCWNGTEV